VMNEFGVRLSASSKYQEKDGTPIPVSEVRTGDLIFFRHDKNGTVFHVSLVISNDEDGLYVVHSTSSRGVVVDNLHTSSYWKAKYATACRVIP
jgi:cell wall-associated NlpC family hydrolase